MLHAVGNPTSAEFTTQVVFDLAPKCELARLDKSWAEVLGCHTALRTGFHWKSDKGSLQFVRKNVALDSRTIELTTSFDTCFEDQFTTILQADKTQPFDLAKAPLLRITYVLASSGEKKMIWTSHHLILDRWCIPIVCAELERNYRDLSTRREKSPSFKHYINHIKGSPPATVMRYWSDYLSDFRRGALLVSKHGSVALKQGGYETIHIPKSDFARLNPLMVSGGGTSALICQLTWFLTVAKLTAYADVVLGVTVSGRPALIPGIERIIGCFINNVPSRAVISPDTTIVGLLDRLASEQQMREPYEHVSLLQLNNELGQVSSHDVKGSRDDVGLIDTLFVWFTTLDAAKREQSSERDKPTPVLSLAEGGQDTASVFPLSLLIYEWEEGLDVNLKLSPGWECHWSLKEILATYRDVLELLCTEDPDTLISQLPGWQFVNTTSATYIPATPSWGVKSQPATTDSELLDDRSGGRESLDRAYVMQVLTAEWQVTLKLDEPDDQRSFFELGGSSIDAARFHSRVESMLRCHIPIISLFTNPYLQDIVDLVIDNDWSMKSDVCMPIRATGSSSPLFCIASPDVNTIGFAQLSNHMNEDVPVFVLQAPPESSTFRSLSPAELPGLAERYVKAMQEVQPTGPYNLFGMCSGAQLTFEMAKILEQQGQSTGLVGILNTWALFTVSSTYRVQQALVRFKLLNQEPLLDRPGVLWRRLIVRRVLDPVRQRLQLLLQNDGQELAASATKGLPVMENGTTTRSDKQDADELMHSNLASEPNMPLDEWVHVYGWHRLYKPGPKLKQRLTVFGIKTQPFWRIRSENLGWELHADSVEMKLLRCDNHHDLLKEPWIAELAQSVESNLQ